MKRDRLERGIKYLESKGYSVLLGEHVFDERGYLAGADSERVRDLHRMFENPEVKAIFCSRGGYGTPRLLDRLDYDLIRAHPKILVGYSDLTALQLALYKQVGLVTFSGPMVAVEMGKGIDPFTEENFWPLLSNPKPFGTLPNHQEHPLRVIRPGKCRGELIGGCLSIISGILGTPYEPSFRDKVLLLEDVGEDPYRIDRYLAQLRLAGILHQVRGILFGQFVDCIPRDEEPSLTIEEVIVDLTGDLDVPIIMGLSYGHVDRKLTLPIGVEVAIDTEGPRIEIVEAAVEDGASALSSAI